MEDNPFGTFSTGADHTSDSGYNPHIDPSLQSALPSQYNPNHLDPSGQHAIPFFPPHAQGANTPYQSLRGPLTSQRHEVQQISSPSASRSRAKAAPQTPHNTSGGQFGVLRLSYPETPLQRLQSDIVHAGQTDGAGGKKEPAHFQGMKQILNPPNLDEWRNKLFSVNEIIYLTEDEFQTYFPHVDNVYSHRSTQQYKRKPFVTSYWDCRLKGRPPGTPKSTDPNKKKRKRVARERNLCDVKIKITEYFPGARQFMNQTQAQPEPTHNDSFFNPDGTFESPSQAQSFAEMMSGVGITSNEAALPGADGKRYYSIQRVNGTGSGGQNEEAAGDHKHDLAESDRIKKNSILRELAKDEKEKKKVKKTYSKKATGAAAATVKRHSKEHDLKFYAGCFCPFVQRVWIALEAKGMDYQYIEIDPYAKPKVLTDINPKGLIPAIRHGSFSCYDSSVILGYLEDIVSEPSLNPPSATQKAYGSLWIDHINKSLVPGFYSLLQAQETTKQLHAAEELRTSIEKLVSAADPEGPFFFGPELSMVDVQAAPHLLRFIRVLTPYRDWPVPEPGSRLRTWLDALEEHPAVKATISGDEVYTDSYERYAENRPGTSQVADAINEGRELP